MPNPEGERVRRRVRRCPALGAAPPSPRRHRLAGVGVPRRVVGGAASPTPRPPMPRLPARGDGRAAGGSRRGARCVRVRPRDPARPRPMPPDGPVVPPPATDPGRRSGAAPTTPAGVGDFDTPARACRVAPAKSLGQQNCLKWYEIRNRPTSREGGRSVPVWNKGWDARAVCLSAPPCPVRPAPRGRPAPAAASEGARPRRSDRGRACPIASPGAGAVGSRRSGTATNGGRTRGPATNDCARG